MEGIAKARAQVLKTMNMMMPRKAEYKHGMTKEEVEKEHAFLVRKKVFDMKLSTYDNRMRDLYHPCRLAGRHTVHGKRHYYPLKLHEEGLVDHNRCEDCQIPEAQP